MSSIVGLEAVERRLEGLKTSITREMGVILEEQAQATQRDIVNMLPHHTGRAIEAMSSPDAIKIKRDKAGNCIEATVGLLSSENRRKAFHLLFL